MRTIEELVKEYISTDWNEIKGEIRKFKPVSSVKDGLEVIIFDASDSEILLKHIGLIREITFRLEGGGTGKDYDIDEYDTGENGSKPFQQLIVYDKKNERIVGGYRFALGRELYSKEGKIESPTESLFNFSERFKKRYLRKSVELGRSFVFSGYKNSKNPELEVKGYQGSKVLFRLLDGLASIVIDNDVRYLFGKVTRYPHHDKATNDNINYHIMKFLENYKSKEKLMRPHKSIDMPDLHMEDEYRIRSYYRLPHLGKIFRKLAENIQTLRNLPPMLPIYLSFSPNMESFGTSENKHFGNTEETGIMIDSRRMYQNIIIRHIIPYLLEKHPTDTGKITKELNKFTRYSVNPKILEPDKITKREYFEQVMRRDVPYHLSRQLGYAKYALTRS